MNLHEVTEELMFSSRRLKKMFCWLILSNSLSRQGCSPKEICRTLWHYLPLLSAPSLEVIMSKCVIYTEGFIFHRQVFFRHLTSELVQLIKPIFPLHPVQCLFSCLREHFQEFGLFSSWTQLPQHIPFFFSAKAGVTLICKQTIHNARNSLKS